MHSVLKAAHSDLFRKGSPSRWPLAVNRREHRGQHARHECVMAAHGGGCVVESAVERECGKAVNDRPRRQQHVLRRWLKGRIRLNAAIGPHGCVSAPLVAPLTAGERASARVFCVIFKPLKYSPCRRRRPAARGAKFDADSGGQFCAPIDTLMQLQTPLCLSYYPKSPLTTEEVTDRARMSV